MTIKQRLLLTRRLIVVLSLTFAPPVGGDPLIFQFGGVIDFVEYGLPISNQITVGAPYLGIYQFDPDEAENTSTLPTIGAYQFGSAGFMSVSFGMPEIVTSDLNIRIRNSTLLDQYEVSNGSPFVAHGTTWLQMQIDLRDATHTAFESTALPLTAPDLDSFALSRRFSLLQPNHRVPSITGTVEFLTMIPEPSCVAFLGSGAACLFLRRGRHRRCPCA